MNYLIHYGIKGQKWGVRRYQNKDGTLTAEGRKRYTDKSMNYDFGKETNKVRREMSNSYSKFKKQPIDISKVKDRSGVSDEDAIDCANLAEAKYREASKKEPKITNDVVKAVSFSGGKCMDLITDSSNLHQWLVR